MGAASDDSNSSRALSKALIGTSGWSYRDWVGPFYVDGTTAKDYLAAYAEQFPVVEVDSTFYGVPRSSTVENWSRRTPEGFRFALKVPRDVTHGAASERPDLDRVLRDDDGVLESFLEAISPLGDKLGVVVLQFPYFRVGKMDPRDFLERLTRTLERLPETLRVAVEVRNKGWIRKDYLELLSRHRAAAVLIDHPYMPPPTQQVARGMVTTDFAYLRLLGDRYAIEKKTTTWEKTVEEKSGRLIEWAEVISAISARPDINRVWTFSNNHFAGHAPATVRELVEELREGGF